MEKKNKFILWCNIDQLLNFNTDAEILNYLNEHNIEYSIEDSSRGNYIAITDSRYFVTPDLLYFLQEKPHE